MSDPLLKTESLRIIDANSNRANEGLRVVEEYLRFVLDDAHLTSLCKQLRHDLADAMGCLDAIDLTAARETACDVGTNVTTEAESMREDARAVAVASQKRVEQSLRCIEEYTKTLLPGVASSIEQLRYRAYTLGKAIEITASSLVRLSEARLYVLIDGRSSPTEFDRHVSSLIEAGVHVLQLRDKRLNDRDLVVRARALRESTRGTATLCLVNDRPDIAALSHADGVHIGQEELTVKDARNIIGPGKLVGVSTHSIEQARQAVLDGADYIGCGPTFPSTTKQFDSFPGLDFLRQVAEEISLPAFAIGGITRQNVDTVCSVGFGRIAVSGCVSAVSDPSREASALMQLLQQREPSLQPS